MALGSVTTSRTFIRPPHLEQTVTSTAISRVRLAVTLSRDEFGRKYEPTQKLNQNSPNFGEIIGEITSASQAAAPQCAPADAEALGPDQTQKLNQESTGSTVRSCSLLACSHVDGAFANQHA